MNTNFETITFEDQDDFGVLTLNRPDKLNALNLKVLSELKEILTSLKSSSIKGMVFTGAGEKAFIAGADIAEMSDMTVEQAKEFGELGQSVTLLFEELPFPVIAAVNGFALGGGCEMAMSCDFIYASEAAVFGQPEVKLGLIPGFGGTQRLAKIIGRNFAKEIIYSGRNVALSEAKELGLVVKSFANKEELMAGAFKTLGKISRNSPKAIAISKSVMNDGNDLTVSLGLKVELEQFSEIFGSEDKKEGCQAFVEKRAANFTGK
ncbi:enoyl-CoA hydratase [Halobacteriovorax marinus]|uniref:Enoyl-CoA hydratase n=1 Tax=Halobacteriovorax marinus TaxID=97084 RepID=A0A1Y5FCH4_9BACT|nr:enoyl-CoA hydratase [Halobacteriovorax marinus]